VAVRGTAIGSSFFRDTWYCEIPDVSQAPALD
jgi:hypothetical protein